MIKDIGTDIVDLVRLSSKDERFIRRILSDEEFELYLQINHPLRRLTYFGGRFAAKEALFKAASCGDKMTNYHDFVILNDENGKPYLFKRPASLEHVNVHISISHTDTHALAYVILEIN